MSKYGKREKILLAGINVFAEKGYQEAKISEIAEKAVEVETGQGLAPVLDACRMVMACHNAVRAHKKLSTEQIRHMLVQLDQCKNPAHCPHGRPTWIHYTLNELERAFKRITG